MLPRLSLLLLLLASSALAQRAVDPRHTYTRVICVVPLVGTGSSAADPKRPQYAPLPGASDPNGILAFYFEPSDDGKSAVVEFVGRDRNAFLALLADRTITLFEKGRATKAQIESALRRVRKDFDLDRFGVVMP
jgi:hypothetical protein